MGAAPVVAVGAGVGDGAGVGVGRGVAVGVGCVVGVGVGRGVGVGVGVGRGVAGGDGDGVGVGWGRLMAGAELEAQAWPANRTPPSEAHGTPSSNAPASASPRWRRSMPSPNLLSEGYRLCQEKNRS